jgi:2-dehydropantoate 2-reductase
MRIAIVGAGGVGGYFGGRLAAAGFETIFVVRRKFEELRVDSILGDFRVAVQTTEDPASAGKADVILMCVKAWQLEDAARAIVPMLKPETCVVPLQNGIDAPDVLARVLPKQHVLGGLAAIVSFVIAPGHIKHAASEPFLMFGELDNSRSERAERLHDAFVQANVDAQVPPDIHRSMWTKFLFIAPLSALGAVTRLPTGAWRSEPETRVLAEQMLREIEAIARARGIPLDENAVAMTMTRYDAMAPDSTSSLQRDVMDGKPSELDAQLGAVVRLGRESGVPTPVTDVVYACLLPLERRARSS